MTTSERAIALLGTLLAQLVIVAVLGVWPPVEGPVSTLYPLQPDLLNRPLLIGPAA